MAGLRAALQAVVAHVMARSDVGARLVFPTGYLPVPDPPTDGTEGAHFDISLRTNMIPGPGRAFPPSVRFVWDVYREVLEQRELVPGAGATAAGRFAAASARFGEGRLTLSEFPYWPVHLVPPVVSSSQEWVHVAIAADELDELGALPDDVEEWMTRFNTLDELGDQLVAAVEFDLLDVQVFRSWLDDQVFTWTSWTLPGEPLSNGGESPSGRLPGYVTALVAVRNLVVTLAPVRLPDVGPRVIYRTDPSGPQLPPASPGLLWALADAFGPQPADSPLAPPGPDTPSLNEQVEKAVRSDGFQRFHVPLRFDVRAAREVVERARAAAVAGAPGPKVRTGHLLQIHDLLEVKTSAPAIARSRRTRLRDHRVPGGVLEGPVDEVFSPPETPPVAAALDRELAVLDHLAGLVSTPEPHVLALVCTRLPRCPNPV